MDFDEFGTYAPYEEEFEETIEPGKKIVCPYCGSENVELIDGVYVCLDCGSVIEDPALLIDTRPETREFQPEDAQTRRYVSSSSLLAIQPPTIWAPGEYRMKAIAKDAKSRNAIYAINTLNEIASKLHLPKQVKDLVLEYFKRLSSKRAIRRERVQAIVAALVYLASRQVGLPKPLDKIAKVSGVKKKDISKAYRMIKEELKITAPVPDAEKFVLSFGKELKLSGETIAKAIQIVKIAKDRGVSIGRDPAGIAAAALYIATRLSGEKRTQKKVAEIAGVTEVTVRNRYREIMKILESSEEFKRRVKEKEEEVQIDLDIGQEIPEEEEG